MLIVQHVTIRWTKATRGAPASNMRAALPRAFALDWPDAAYVLHRVLMGEPGFAPRTSISGIDTVPRTCDALHIQPLEAGAFRLGLAGCNSGQPHRHSALHAITLQPGRYARLAINGRHAWHSGQWYTEDIFNVANGAAIPPNRFLGAPDHALDLMADLF